MQRTATTKSGQTGNKLLHSHTEPVACRRTLRRVINNHNEKVPMNTDILNRFLQLSAHYLGVRHRTRPRTA